MDSELTITDPAEEASPHEDASTEQEGEAPKEEYVAGKHDVLALGNMC